MKIFKSEEYIKMANPTPGTSYRPEILTQEHQAKNLGGNVRSPGCRQPGAISLP